MPQHSLKLDVIREALNIRTNKQTRVCLCRFKLQALLLGEFPWLIFSMIGLLFYKYLFPLFFGRKSYCPSHFVILKFLMQSSLTQNYKFMFTTELTKYEMEKHIPLRKRLMFN